MGRRARSRRACSRGSGCAVEPLMRLRSAARYRRWGARVARPPRFSPASCLCFPRFIDGGGGILGGVVGLYKLVHNRVFLVKKFPLTRFAGLGPLSASRDRIVARQRPPAGRDTAIYSDGARVPPLRRPFRILTGARHTPRGLRQGWKLLPCRGRSLSRDLVRERRSPCAHLSVISWKVRSHARLAPFSESRSIVADYVESRRCDMGRAARRNVQRAY